MARPVWLAHQVPRTVLCIEGNDRSLRLIGRLSSHRPDLILPDTYLPDMDGHEVLRRLPIHVRGGMDEIDRLMSVKAVEAPTPGLTPTAAC